MRLLIEIACVLVVGALLVFAVGAMRVPARTVPEVWW